MNQFTAREKQHIRANALAFLYRPLAADLPAMLGDALTDADVFRSAARNEPAAVLVALMELWARAIGAEFAEAVRRAARNSESQVLEETQRAVWRFATESAEVTEA